MLEFEQLKLRLLSHKQEIIELKDAIGYDGIKREIEELELKSAAPGFWDDPDASQSVLQKTGRLKNKIEGYDTLRSSFDDLEVLIDMGDEEGDLSLIEEISQSIDQLENDLSAQTLSTLLTGEYDKNNAILTFHSGAGGTEAMDWVAMLVRMYTHWAEKHGFSVSMPDFLDGDEAGLKSATLLIEGENAYGYLKSESGVHRLVRVSPFDASGRRHTSFAAIEVMPEISDDIQIEIRDDDVKMDVFRASGAGGQHINKTSSAVRLTHIPTGIVVACQNERSQFQNKEQAMKMLKSKLLEIKEREHLEKIEDIKGVQMENAWGSQIRSYVFMPYTMVKDHRTEFETGNINAVMDGEIDGFINAYLKYNTKDDKK
ncbi:MAG: peptide chain release factor 2 [Clostridia bacterium]|nr:peptide chain release factor 2 [Clostridia bacterium]